MVSGDLKGITSRLDYLADLGVDVLWLSPVYRSPQDDNGYDISDYRDIDPLFGTLDDMDELLAEAHRRGLKIVMDLVVNHTSDEHAWFEASKDKDDPHADWYWWRPARPGHEPGTPGAEPNQWGSYFGGSAWEYSPERGEYYLHQFSKKQPDLNWENPAVRRAVYDMMNWWLDRGIDGFRMDVITLISKRTDANGRLPGEYGSELQDLPVGEEGYSSPNPFCADGPRQDEFLAEMRREVFDGRDGFLTVGEAPGITAERNEQHHRPRQRRTRHALPVRTHGRRPNPRIEMGRQTMDAGRPRNQARRTAGRHRPTRLGQPVPRQPRPAACRLPVGATTPARPAAFALPRRSRCCCTCTAAPPYVYQGEELGMTNAHFTSLDQYRDLESINAYHQRVEETGIRTSETMMRSLARYGRDNARTPMQWDDSTYAGFTMPDAPVEPWIAVNPNHTEINAADEIDDPDSVYSFHKRLIALRHTDPVVAAGDYRRVETGNDRIIAFTRTLDERTILTVINLSPTQAAPAGELETMPDGTILIANTDDPVGNLKTTGTLGPWEAFAMETDSE